MVIWWSSVLYSLCNTAADPVEDWCFSRTASMFARNGSKSACAAKASLQPLFDPRELLRGHRR